MKSGGFWDKLPMMTSQRSCKIKLIILGAHARGSRDGLFRAGIAETPFGKALIGERSGKVAHLSFVPVGQEGSAWRELQKEWPHTKMLRRDAWAGRFARKIFKTRKPSLKMKVLVRGTAFQCRVWKEICKIPFGERISYGDLAKRIGQPKASRAIGSAVGKNAVAMLIPCHRVIREDGSLGGYRWGKAVKQSILAWESKVI
jgi:AraC family transcriptional regulator of adaptative response/methylated-DNA-[protein]-cysteine methyltransferase